MQQDECRPLGAEDVNGSVHVNVHFCFINCYRRAHLADVSADIILREGKGVSR
jgi:hypothetical protein